MDELIIKNKEVKEVFVNTINNSGLPAFILKSILKDLYNELEKIDEQQLQVAIDNKNKKNKKGEKKDGI